MNQATLALRRLSPHEIRRRYPSGGLQLLEALTEAENLDQTIAIVAASAAQRNAGRK